MALNRYKLVHVTQFSYDGPVSESYNELRLRPRHDESQSCLSFRITTNPQAQGQSRISIISATGCISFISCRNIASCASKRRPWCWCIRRTFRRLPSCCFPNSTGCAILWSTIITTGFRPRSIVRFCLPSGNWFARPRSESDGTVHGFAQAASALIHERFTLSSRARRTCIRRSQDSLETRRACARIFRIC